MKYPGIEPEWKTVLELREVSRAAAEREAAATGRYNTKDFTLIEAPPSAYDPEELLQRRTELLDELATLNDLLDHAAAAPAAAAADSTNAHHRGSPPAKSPPSRGSARTPS